MTALVMTVINFAALALAVSIALKPHKLWAIPGVALDVVILISQPLLYYWITG